MRRTRLTIVAIAVAFAVTALALPAAAAQPQYVASAGQDLATRGATRVLSASQSTTTNVLHWGQRLTAGTTKNSLTMSTPTSTYVVLVGSGSLEIDQYAPENGPSGPNSTATTLWLVADPTGETAPRDASTLTVMPGGNLVLAAASGRVLWTSNTAGMGTNSALAITAQGDLVLTTGAGKVTWHSNTTSVLLTAGQSLAAGSSWRAWYWNGRQDVLVATMTIRTDGDLLFRCGTQIVWQSNTFIAGSHVSMTTSGNLEVVGPYGLVRWQSNSGRAGPYSWLRMPDMTIYNQAFSVMWAAHQAPTSTCTLM